MRIGQFTDTFLPVVDGVGRVAHAYATELAALGHEVTVVAPMYDTGHRGGQPFELVDYLGYKVPTAPQYLTGTAAMDNHYRRRMRMIPLDIIHTHGPFSAGREALRLARARNIPLVATFHSKYYDDFYKATKSEALSKIAVSNIVNFFEKCDDVWAVSESTADVLRGYGYQGPVRVIPNGVAIRRADPQRVQELEQQLGLGDAPMFLFVGQLNWKKNLLRVLEAAALLRQAGHPFYLVLAGQGPDGEAVQAKAQALGITDRLIMPGHITDTAMLDALYARASMFVFPSLYDNAPMVLREAAVMGTPAVLVQGSDAAEIVRDRETGFLCRDEADDLARVMALAIHEPEQVRRAGMGAQGSIPVPWSAILAQAAQAYEQIIASFTGRPDAWTNTPSRRKK